MSNPGRNDPCPCGSGKKYTKCCLGQDNFFQKRPAPVATDPKDIYLQYESYEVE